LRKDKTKDKIQQQKTRLKNYINRVKSNRVDTEFKQTSKYGGRYYCDSSLQVLSKFVRGSIANQHYLDLDIVNCHPNIILKMFKHYNMEAPNLESYVTERDTWLDGLKNEGYTREQAKDLVLMSIYDDDEIKTNFIELKKLQQEIEQLKDRVVKDYPEIYQERVKECKKKNKKNFKGSTLSFICQTKENEYLMEMINFFQKKKLITNDYVLCHDGAMIPKMGDIDRHVNELNNIVDKGIEWKVKPFKVIDWNKVSLPECNCKIEHKEVYELLRYIMGKCKQPKTRNMITSSIKNIFPSCEKEFITFIQHMIPTIEDKIDLQLDYYWFRSNFPKSSRNIEQRSLIEILSRLAPNQETEQHEIINQDTQINFKDDYTIHDLSRELRKTIFDTRQELDTFLCENLPKVCIEILNPQFYLINLGKGKTDMVTKYNMPCFYTQKTNDGKMEIIQKNILSGENKYINTSKMVNSLTPYDKITYDPSPNYNDKYVVNQYTGFKSEEIEGEVDMNLIQPFLNHWLTCWANDDKDKYDYIEQWHREAFLHPHKKNGTVLLLYGSEGTGKGVLIDNLVIPYIYGENNACVSHGLTPITQRFNTICMNKLFICCNEVSNEGMFHSSFEKLKALITDPTMPIEKKGIDIFEDYPNYINFIMTTNNKDSVKLGRTDRRYNCIETSDRYIGNYEYFEKLISACTQEAANHLYTYLIRLPKTRNIKKLLQTKLKDEMSINAIPTSIKFLNDLHESYEEMNIGGNNNIPEWLKIIRHNMNEDNMISSSHLYESYNTWCSFSNERKMTKNKFGRDIKPKIESIRSNGTKYILFNKTI
jgi:hypothetical protein